MLNLLRAIQNTFFRLGSQGILIAVIVLCSLALFVVPVNKDLLDIFLVINITTAVTLLVRSLLVSDPIRLFSFPTILLLTTLFRLALNVSSTRLILLNGDTGLSAAGEIIRAFGNFVIQGDFVVGAIVFCLISVVNFLVIAKGSSRVAEVAARFVLDALPGRQLAIDADLRSGIITAKDAEVKREELNRVSQFYGAMDGAMKFVQGDAIAGLVITAINAFGGLSIGISKGLSLEEAVRNFGVLTIGDGLVTIIPALLISVCAGIVVTHVSGQTKKGSSSEIFSQIIEEPVALLIAAISLLLVGLIPGFPFFPFLIVSGSILLALLLPRYFKTNKFNYQSFFELVEQGDLDRRSEIGLVALPFRILTLELDKNSFQPVLSNKSSKQYTEFNSFLSSYWNKIHLERGLELPKLALAFSELAPTNSFRVKIREELVYSGFIPKDCIYVELSPPQLRAFGIQVLKEGNHPLTGQQFSWIKGTPENFNIIEELQVGFYSELRFVILKVASLALEHCEIIYGLEELKTLIVQTLSSNSALREEIFEREVLSYSECTELLKKLILEDISIRDMKLFFEAITDYAARFKAEESRSIWLLEMYEFVRERLQRRVEHGKISNSSVVFKVSEATSEAFRSALTLWDFGVGLPPLKEEKRKKIEQQIFALFAPLSERGIKEYLLLSPRDIRFALMVYLKVGFPKFKQIRVISEHELQNINDRIVIAQI